MHGDQFLRVFGYASHPRANARNPGGASSNPSTSRVIGEAFREPWASGHVANPLPPDILFGTSDPDAVRAEIDQTMSKARKRNLQPIIRSARNFVGGIASWPEPLESEDKQAALRWQARTVEWVKQTWGDAVRYVLVHVDETHRHIHWGIVAPIVDRVLRYDKIHPGAAAGEKARAEGLSKAKQQRAHKEAVRALQLDYAQQVGLPSGLSRGTPGSKRLTNRQFNLLRTREATVAAVSAALDDVPHIDLARQAAAARVAAQEADRKRAKAEAEAQGLRGRLAAAERRVAELLAMLGPEPVRHAQRGRGRGEESGFRVL